MRDDDKYKRGFEIACRLLNGDNIYGVDANNLNKYLKTTHETITAFSYCFFIIRNLDRFSDNKNDRMEAIRRLGF